MSKLIGFTLFLLALLSSSYASTAIVSVDGLSFQANVNISTTDSRFSYRHTSFDKFPAIPLALYTSVDVQAQGSQTGGSAKVDSIVGICSVPYNIPIIGSIGYSPSAWMFYFKAEANFDVSSVTLDSDFSATAALVGKVFTKIEEISASGTVVSTYTLKQRGWDAGSVTTSGPNNELKYLTYTSDDDSFVVSITYAVSSVVGKLNVGGATITPRNMESFVEIRNYPYGNPENHLRLTVYLGHVAAAGSATFSGTKTVIAGKDKEQIYFKLSGEAVVDGSVANVEVNGLSKADISPSEIDNVLFTGALTANGNLKSEVRKIEIDFPKGATKISYDPAMGFGAPNAAGLLIPSFAVLLLSIAVFFFVL